MLKLLIPIFFLAGMMSCDSNKVDIYKYVTSVYTTQEINYFYELCFNENDTVYKWDRNVLFYLEGDTLPGDKAMIVEIVTTINNLKLPIKIEEASKKINCNLVIRSAPDEDLKLEKPNRAFTRLFNTANRIDSARIGISNRLYKGKRKSFLLHEFFHSLGFTSHVTTNSKSVLFSFKDTTALFSDSEKSALKLLYEDTWNDLYLKTDFENVFSSVLYGIKPKEKFLEFVRTDKPNLEVLQEILKHGLIQYDSLKEPQIVKHINPLKIILKGTVPKNIDLESTLRVINSATPNLNLEHSHNPNLQFGIFLDFILHDTVPKEHILINFKNILLAKAVFPTIIITDIKIYYNKEYSNFKKSLGSVLYQAVTLKDYNYAVEPFDILGDDLRFKPLYKELLQVYYAKEFPHKLSKTELEQGIKEYRLEIDSLKEAIP